jgi:hypothetical protein
MADDGDGSIGLEETPGQSGFRFTFDSTLDEKVVANMRLYEITGLMSRHKWPPLVLAPVGGFVCFLLMQGAVLPRVMSGVFFAVVYSVLHLAMYRRDLARNMRRHLARQFGTREPIPSVYVIDDQVVSFSNLGTTISFEWGSVKEIIEAAAAVEMIVEPAGIARIPNRLFSDSTEKRRFLEYSRARMSGAGRAGARCSAEG